MNKKERERDKGYLFVIGGPGGSGSSTIAKMLSQHFNLERVYAGSIFRDTVAGMGFDSFEDFYVDGNQETLFEIDIKVDSRMLEEAGRKDVLLESKVFAAIATTQDIPCTVKIWLDSSLHVRTLRHISNEKYSNIFSKLSAYLVKRRDLKKRFRLDSERYLALYGIDYMKPELYNDIVLDSSKLNEEETFNLILELIEDGEYLKGCRVE